MNALGLVHKYKRSLIGVTLVAVVCLSMGGFGLSMGGPSGRQGYAIKVDDAEISFEQVKRTKEQMEYQYSQYRQMLGENYQRFMAQLGLQQQAIDRLIADALLDKQAKALEFFPPTDDEIARTIRDDVFAGSFNMDQYQNFLKQSGLTASDFQGEISKGLQRSQFSGMLADFSLVTQKEIRPIAESKLTKYNVNYLELNPQDFVAQVKEPEAEVLEKFYLANSTNYEKPVQAKYDYVVFEPKDGLNLVELAPEDIEIYYVEHQRDYLIPEMAKVKHIQIKVAENADAAAKETKKIKAEEARAKLLAGESFSKVAMQYSEDLVTKSLGGDLGWISRGQKDKVVDKAIFALSEGQTSDVISTDSGFEIFTLESKKASQAKPLEDVRAEIEKKIRESEAPAYIATKAHDLFSKWQKSASSLTEFVTLEKLELKSTASLLSPAQAPEPTLNGLTAAVLNNNSEQRRLVELNDKFILVEIKERIDPEIPPLAEIKDKVLQSYRVNESNGVTLEKANQLLAQLKGAKFKNLMELAKANNLPLKSEKELSLNANPKPPFSDPQMQRALFSQKTPNQVPTQVFSVAGKFYLCEVSAITKPNPSEVDKELIKAKEEVTRDSAEVLIASLVNQLKAKAQIDVSPSLYSES